MTFPLELWIIFGISALCGSVGFYRWTWFSSIGYGLSVAACGTILWVLFRGEMGRAEFWACMILIVFGLRLALYLLLRERLSPSFRRHRAGAAPGGRDQVDMGVRLMTWFGCTILYTLMLAPICYRLVGDAAESGTVIAGVCVMAAGVLLETAADLSKAGQKKRYPGEVCRRGLYRFVRCPNYFGEILLWTGVLLTGITSLQTPGQWIVSLLGYLGILLVMIGAARRLEIIQNRKYGKDPRYQRYVRRVPILIPLIPVRSLERLPFPGK